MNHIWVLEKRNGNGAWEPHPNYDWFDTKAECRRYSKQDKELRTVKYARVTY